MCAGDGVCSGRRFVLLLAVLTLLAMLTPVAAGAAGAFNDDDGSIFEADIEWLAASGITKGCNPPTNDRFCPTAYVTRGQMAAFLVRALGYTNAGTGDLFTDDDGSIFEADIDRLGTAGVTKGCNPPTNDLFCPNNYVTRGQMAAFLVRALGYTNAGTGDLFTDDDGSIFEADIDRLGTAGVTKGCNPPTNDLFCPNNYVTRGQMAAFLHRALGTAAAPADVAAYLGDLPDWGWEPDGVEDPPNQGYVEFDREFGDQGAEFTEWVGDQEYVCTDVPVTLWDTPQDIVMFDAMADVVYPGVLLEGDSYAGGAGTLKELPIRQRTPLTVFATFLNGDASRQIVNPTPSRINNAIGDLVSSALASGYEVGTDVDYHLAQTYSASQLALDLGLAVRYMRTSVATDLAMTRTATQQTLTANFIEGAYTVTMDAPQFPEDLFSDAFTKELLDRYVADGTIGPGNLPAYVKKVTYGRMMTFSFTSTLEISEMRAAVLAAYNGIKSDVTGGFAAQWSNLHANSDFKFTSIGGDSAAAASAIVSGDFRQYFTERPTLTQYVPIAFEVVDLNGNTAYLGDVATYDIRTCEPAPEPGADECTTGTCNVKVTFDELEVVSVNDKDDASDREGAFELDLVAVDVEGYNRNAATPEGDPGSAVFDPSTDCLIDGADLSSTELVCWSGYKSLLPGDGWPDETDALGPWSAEIPFDNTGPGDWEFDTLKLKVFIGDDDQGIREDDRMSFDLKTLVGPTMVGTHWENIVFDTGRNYTLLKIRYRVELIP